MTSKVDSMNLKSPKISISDNVSLFDAQKEIRVMFKLPQNFVCGKDDKIVLHKKGELDSLIKDIVVDVDIANYDSKNGFYLVIFSVDMLRGIQKDTEDEYCFEYLNSRKETIGESINFRFTQNPELPIYPESRIKDHDNPASAVFSEIKETSVSLNEVTENIKYMFETFYTKILSALMGNSNYLPFEEYFSKSNNQKEQEINFMIDAFCKKKEQPSDLILNELKTLKDNIFYKITEESNKLSLKMESIKSEHILDEKNMRMMHNVISSTNNKASNPQLDDICKNLKEIQNCIDQSKCRTDEKIPEKKSLIVPIIQENQPTEPIFCLSEKNPNSKIIQGVDLDNTEKPQENWNINEDKVQVSTPQISNETKENITIINDSIFDIKETFRKETIPKLENFIKEKVQENNPIIDELSLQINKKNETDSSSIHIKGNNNSFAAIKRVVPVYYSNLKYLKFNGNKTVNDSGNSKTTLQTEKN